jgi:ceramide glucosyltransferase
LDHSRRRQCVDAEGLYPASSDELAAPVRHCLLHALGLAARQSLGELECAFLNTFEARWQYCAEAFGMGFAQGKSMLWRRQVMDKGAGSALGTEIAEDAASTKLVRGSGLDVNLVDSPFEQPLGFRGFRDIWLRQLRWA